MPIVAVLERLGAEGLRDIMTTFRDAVKAHQEGINRLNVYPVPDGDTGTNMARTLDAVVGEVEAAADDLGSTCKAIAHGSLMGARGNSGVILSQILRGFVGVLERMGATGDLTGERVAEAFEAASASAYKAVLKPIEGTILTVTKKASIGARRAADRGGRLVDVLREARSAGREALADTPNQLAVLKEAGVVDAGGAGFLLLLDAALNVVAGDPIPEPEVITGLSLAQFERVAHRGHDDVSDLRYEVMYFLDLVDDLIEDFKQGWAAIGGSIVVVGGDGIWNCHVHTNDVGAAVEVALDLGGRPRGIRVTDLFDEVGEEHAAREARMYGGEPPAIGLPAVTTAVVAVCSGDGLAELFWQLGVQGIVTGGQTMNPSTAELLEAVAHVNAREVVLLPNNKNIIPVAEQVNALTDKTVRVVPTQSMPEALAALVVYDPVMDAEANAAEMTDAAASVVTGEVTQAVRDVTTSVGAVRVGDWIGLVRGDGIVAVADNLLSAMIALLEHIVSPTAEIVTVIEGADAPSSVTASLVEWIHEHRPGAQAEVHRGGHQLYPYLVGVE
ncbi:MAG: DAK2 domain-containing protein [Actinobacteria bacterium]|uniref:Unannotated protein n=1 Tax=freshwater metagenome TaxID=449393 RepID=A0A6J7CMH7_9ZZZZ|nr:DAK2 domain-containing protein [Actinomycetota bacterium]MSY11543.1 DAK2 domain-containing protein [Actinomycetota bacterium]MTB07003.1 DAK2 domain-containing protein [Actinomycetota bacterium]